MVTGGLNIKLYRNGKLHSLLGWMLPKTRIISKKGSNKSFLASNFGQKSPPGHMSISPRVELGGSKDMVYILNCIETENCIHFWAECCRKYALFWKKIQIKVFRHRISDKKVREGICLSSPRVELGTSKDDMVEKCACIFPFLHN